MINQQALAVACEDHGFFLLAGHGHDPLVNEVFAQAQSFFAQPTAVKRSVYRNESNPLGYYDRELTKQRRDLKKYSTLKPAGIFRKPTAAQSLASATAAIAPSIN